MQFFQNVLTSILENVPKQTPLGKLSTRMYQVGCQQPPIHTWNFVYTYTASLFGGSRICLNKNILRLYNILMRPTLGFLQGAPVRNISLCFIMFHELYLVDLPLSSCLALFLLPCFGDQGWWSKKKCLSTKIACLFTHVTGQNSIPHTLLVTGI